MWDGVDRRRYVRVQYPCLITVRKKIPPAFSTLTHTEDISIGGVHVIVRKRIEVATEVDLEIDLKDTLPNVASTGRIAWVKKALPIHKGKPAGKDTGVKVLTGTVAWVKEIPSTQKGKPPRYDTGIQFIILKDEDRERIQSIVERMKL